MNESSKKSVGQFGEQTPMNENHFYCDGDLKLLDTKQAAKIFCVTPRTLYSYRKGGLAYLQIGRKVLYSYTDILSFMANHRIN